MSDRPAPKESPMLKTIARVVTGQRNLLKLANTMARSVGRVQTDVGKITKLITDDSRRRDERGMKEAQERTRLGETLEEISSSLKGINTQLRTVNERLASLERDRGNLAELEGRVLKTELEIDRLSSHGATA